MLTNMAAPHSLRNISMYEHPYKVKSVVLWYVLVHNLFRWVALRAERAKAAA